MCRGSGSGEQRSKFTLLCWLRPPTACTEEIDVSGDALKGTDAMFYFKSASGASSDGSGSGEMEQGAVWGEQAARGSSRTQGGPQRSFVQLVLPC